MTKDEKDIILTMILQKTLDMFNQYNIKNYINDYDLNENSLILSQDKIQKVEKIND